MGLILGCTKRFIAFAFLVLAASSVTAQQFPQKTIRIIVGYPPGGGSDLIARVVGEQLSLKLATPVIVENVPGAGSSISVATAAKAPADGYTILLATSSFTINPNLYKKVNYDPIKDFDPIARIGDSPFYIVAQASSPINTVQELITQAKAKPGALRYSSGGNGSVGHLVGEVFKSMAGVDIQHIPYKGLTAGIAGLLGGQVDITMSDLASALSTLKAGRIKMLGVTTKQRVARLPNVPTIAESGVPGYEVVLWYGLMVPADTPKPVENLLHTTLRDIVTTPEKKVLDRYDALGIVPPEYSTQEAFSAFIKHDLAFWAKAVKNSGATTD
ncbi:MAG: tripartite tricarboxylate transporter substrate binding protein [Betaproteobacteria bacterium]|nr:MAG: tripartite tricarboxylate transporter substrate binding protein [Betaproteobacteria bacterium]